eukprot:9509684-Prorocentrum_lima.AAC.1
MLHSCHAYSLAISSAHATSWHCSLAFCKALKENLVPPHNLQPSVQKLHPNTVGNFNCDTLLA